jgi:hypothetical protein
VHKKLAMMRPVIGTLGSATKMPVTQPGRTTWLNHCAERFWSSNASWA